MWTALVALTPVAASGQIFKPPLVSVGDSVRVRLRDPGAIIADIRLMSSRPREQSGRVVVADHERLTMSINSRVATVAGIGIGHITNDHEVRYDQLERLDVFRGFKVRKPGPLRIALSVAVAGGAFALSQSPNTTCGDKPCTLAQRRVAGVIAGSLCGAATAFWPVTRWASVQLPSP